MQSTIGELTSVLLEFSSMMELKIMYDMPYIKAYLVGKDLITKAVMFIVQTREHEYAVCDTNNDSGNKYLLTGSNISPFISETNFINSSLGKPTTEDKYCTGLNLETFTNHLYYRLYYYGIIRFDPSLVHTYIADMGFKSLKIRKRFNSSFGVHRRKSGRILDLLEIVVKKGKSFSLDGLSDKESHCIYAKFRDLGLNLKIEDNRIVDIKFN